MSDVPETMSGDAAKDAIIDKAMAMSTSRPLEPDSFLELMNVDDPDRFMRHFWGNLVSGDPITIDVNTLDWLGYKGSTPAAQRQAFRRMLDNIDTHIPYELNRTPARLGPPAEWVRTKRYPYITRFFVELEHAVRTYGDYTKAYEARASTRKEEERQYDHDTQLKDEKDRYEMQERLLHSAQQTSARCREQERAKSARFVPPDAVPSREERLVLMQMSAGYTRAGSDPAYLRDCTLLFIRSHKEGSCIRGRHEQGR